MDYKRVARSVFLITALYDFVLGIAFLLFYKQVLGFFSISIPNFPEYLQMSAAFVAVLGVGYFLIYLNLEKNKDLYRIGMLYKLIYIVLVSYYYFIVHTANVVYLNFAMIDTIFLIIFIVLYKKVYP